MRDAAISDPVFAFDNSYARLPERFYVRQAPTPVAAPALIKINVALANDLGLDAEALASPAGLAILAGNRLPTGAAAIAVAYAGHQFGHLQPQLGDGRAVLLGEVITPTGGRVDVQLKGAGRTPFSRGGDGRAALGPVLREYVVSEAMAALGIPSARALAAVTTGEHIRRETMLPGAILTRVAASHIRVGTFQYFAVRGDVEALGELAAHVIDRHYPAAGVAANPPLALLDAVIERQAQLVARWMLVGFIHGVMNTDNCSIAGETIDFGPCAFMDAYDPNQVYSSIDTYGRYAYSNQPSIAQWNLTRFAETLVPLIAPDQAAAIALAQSSLDRFWSLYTDAYNRGLNRKLGLGDVRDGDAQLGKDLLDAMATAGADFTTTFRQLSDHDGDGAPAAFNDGGVLAAWLQRWKTRAALEGRDQGGRRALMRAANPAFIPRNHRIEAMIVAAVDGDFAPFERLITVLAHPYDDQPDMADLSHPPLPEDIVRATFCGT